MRPGNLDPGLVPVPAAFLLARQVSCLRLSFFSARRKNRGEAIFRPSDSTAKWVRPRSMPTAGPASGSMPGSVSITNDAK